GRCGGTARRSHRAGRLDQGSRKGCGDELPDGVGQDPAAGARPRRSGGGVARGGTPGRDIDADRRGARARQAARGSAAAGGGVAGASRHPSAINTATPPTTFASYHHGCASPGGATNPRTIENATASNPATPTATVSGVRRRRSLRYAPKT